MTSCAARSTSSPGRREGLRSAFTLLELMIAMALGLMIIYLAMSSFRVASQSITAVNRMSTENAIIRAGLWIALNDTDFWLSYDDPSDAGNHAGRQPLRAAPVQVAGVMRGLPFTSFAQGREAGAYPYVADAYKASTPWQADEAAQGWNPNAWTPSESRSWAWVNLVERVPVSSAPGKVQTFGTYHAFTSTSTTSPHPWQQRQLDGLNKTIGYFGLFDYLPSNTPLALYAKNAAGAWAISREWCFVNGSQPFYIGNDNRLNGLNFAQDQLSATYGSPFVIPSPLNAADTLVATAYQRYATGITLSTSDNNGSISSVEQLLKQGTINTAWLPESARPATWPSMSVSALRYVLTSQFACLNRIRWTSPLTGQLTELSFSAFGTTLRGARQQRRRDGAGWADPFTATPAADPTLDSY